MGEKITALYMRVSTDGQSTDSQRVALESFCDARGWSNRVFFEDVASGAKFSRREFDALMKRVRAGLVARVVVHRLDRLGRSLVHLAMLGEEFSRYGVALVATEQGIDTSSDSAPGRFQLQMLAAFAEYERAIIRDRVKSGLVAARKRGSRLGRGPGSSARVKSAEATARRMVSSEFRTTVSAIAEATGVSLGTAHRLRAKARRAITSEL